MSLPIVCTVAELKGTVDVWRQRGASVAVVPTMGALHDGHLSLVRAAREGADKVIVTLFVNPKQFNDPDDLSGYPRSEQEDAGKLATLGTDLLYAPNLDEIYPEGFSTNISVAGISQGLCGAYRPGHFDGVATVVTKLFLQTGADLAYFGEKDFQQLQVVRRLVRDLDIPIEIIGCPTIREEDGLAMSSRNENLTSDERRRAPAKSKILVDIAERITAVPQFVKHSRSGGRAFSKPALTKLNIWN